MGKRLSSDNEEPRSEEPRTKMPRAKEKIQKKTKYQRKNTKDQISMALRIFRGAFEI